MIRINFYGYDFNDLKTSCFKCGQEAEDLESRGRVKIVFGTLQIHGYGYCRNCNHIYPVHLRYKVVGRNCLRVEFIRNGEWVYQELKSSWRSKAKSFLLNLLTKLSNIS